MVIVMRKFLTATLCAAILLLTGCGNEQPPVEVTAAKVIAADGTLTLTHDGKISLSDELKVLSPINGNVVATFSEVGAAVTEGQKLFQIGTQQDATALVQAKAQLGESMTALAREMSELQRAEVQLKQNAISPAEVDDKRFKVDDRRAEVAERQERVKQLEEAQSSGTVLAHKSGTLGERIQLGAAVTANETVLATIGRGDPSVVRFEISAEEKQSLLSSAALKVTLKLADGKIYPHEGTLNFIAPATVEAVFANPDGTLQIGEAAQVVFDGVSVSKVLLIPESAIQQRGEDNYVFVVDKNKSAALKKISLDGKLGSLFIVKDGLTADDSVIVDGLNKLREGTPLKLTD